MAKRDISPESADQVVTVAEMVEEATEIAPLQVKEKIATGSTNTKEEALIAANAVEAAPSKRKIRARSVRNINLIEKRKRVKKVVADLLLGLSHDHHDLSE